MVFTSSLIANLQSLAGTCMIKSINVLVPVWNYCTIKQKFCCFFVEDKHGWACQETKGEIEFHILICIFLSGPQIIIYLDR